MLQGRLNRVSKQLGDGIYLNCATVFARKKKQQKAEEELFTLIESDPVLLETMKHYPRESIRSAYKKLSLPGLGEEWIHGKLVAVSALAFEHTLHFVLVSTNGGQEKDPEVWKLVLRRLIDYFKNDEKGPIKTSGG